MSSMDMKSLGQKIVNAILGTTLTALVLAFLLSIVPTIYLSWQVSMDRASAQAELLAASLAAPVDFVDPAAAAESLATLSLVQSVTGAAVYMGEGKPFATYGEPPARPSSRKMTVRSNLTSLTVVSPIPADQPDCFLVMAVSLDRLWVLLKNQILISFVIVLIVFAMSYKLAGFFRKKLGDPLGKLTRVVRELAKSKNYSRRVDYESDDEIGVLVNEFNAMLGQVEQRDVQLNRHRVALEEKVEERTRELKQKQLELLRNNQLILSEVRKRAKAEMIREEVERINRHDLKSGLSLVIGYPELLLNEGELTARQEKHIKRIRAAGYRMLDMIRNQLDIFKMEKGIYSLRRSRVDIVEVICSLEDEFGPLLESAGVAFGMQLNGVEVVGDEAFTITGDMSLVRTMLRNLIQNGIEASSPGDTLSVMLYDGHCKEISITNPKPVPEDMRHRFFDKYATHGKENGTGLGTYFAGLIAKTHGASISMRTDDSAGTVVSIYFKESLDGKTKAEVAASGG